MNEDKIQELRFAVYPDSIKMGLSNENELMAIFRARDHAKTYASHMWGNYYIIEEINQQ